MMSFGRRARSRRSQPALTEDRPTNVVGAGYLHALYNDDADMVAHFREAFTAEELLDSLTVGSNAPVMILGRRCAVHERKTLEEYGAALVKTAALMQRAFGRSA